MTTGNWNRIDQLATFPSTGNPTVVLDADLNRFSDNQVTGVGISVGATGDFNVGIGGLTATAGSVSFTTTGAIPSTAQSGVVYIQSESVSFTFTGLCNRLT